ncbi:MAG: HypC/HybG/HupF family hydrogenase formation chaperone [Clostridia bacterium]|uniref:HupF/HypC family protein n=1 Tax=Neomoorella glycerini TaxID=55779 RepID=A0A6I5ZMB0_9FIRM|nr:HypC/HybG/HupF family hydrogenase formation chaperone [Moorella glycerini]MBC7340962.1 HypC/HybG/HupF family hydrogenase formation chaperone [Clostridia bacterium]QGP91010.1 HupF/HypC family protein [Moorella glycerini]
MCLAVPAKIYKIEGLYAWVDIMGNRRRISIGVTPEVKVGDFVLLHAGYAISKLDMEEALETLKLWEEINGVTTEV